MLGINIVKQSDITIFTNFDIRDMNYNTTQHFSKYILVLFLALLSNLAFAQTASFTLNDNVGCRPFQLEVVNTSTGATSYSWTVNTPDGGESSTLENPSFIIDTSGTFDVTLSINGGASVSTQSITINPRPDVLFTANTTSGCAPLTVSFTDMTNSFGVAITDWFWEFDVTSTAQNPTVVFTENGSVSVDLLVTDANGCEGIGTINNYINVSKPSEPDFSVVAASSCEVPFVASIDNNTDNNIPGVNYSWSISGSGATIQNPNSYDPGDVNITQNGSYDVTLTTELNGCTDDTTITNAISVDELIASFSVNNTQPCVGSNFTFVNTSNIPGLVYVWQVDGVTESSGSPNFPRVFDAPGDYDVSLIASTLAGDCIDTATQTINIQAGPSGDFFADATSSCDATSFSPQFTTTQPAANYQWSVNGGGTVLSPNSQTTNMTFPGPGNYTVTLLLTSSNGCERTITKTNYIKISDQVVLPIITDAPDNQGCAPLDITLDLNQNSLPPNVNVTSVNWTLPGGTNSGGPGSPTSISTTYQNIGSYTVTATVTLDGGCSVAPIQQEITVGELPTISANVDKTDLCLNETISGTATSSVPNTQFDWYFESSGGYVNGGIGTSSSVNYIYEDEWTNYEVFMVANSGGCKDTVVIDVKVDAPGAKFTFERECGSNTRIRLIPDAVQSQFADNFVWNLITSSGPVEIGSATSINGAVLDYDFGSIGVYQVELQISSSFTGCSDTRTQTIDLSQIQGNATVTPIACAGEAVSYFDDTDGILAWQWFFGDGDSTDRFATATTITHEYANPGMYSAKLVTRNSDNCIDSTFYSITIGGGTADIGGTLGACVTPFNGNFNTSPSVFPIGGVDSANWVIDNGTVPFLEFNDQLNVGPINYANQGQYSIQLTAFDPQGCSDDTTVNIFIGGAIADFNADRTTVCPGEEIKFQNNSLGGNLTYNWNFGSNAIPSTSTDKNPTVIYNSAGAYDVTLTVVSNVDGATCTDTETKSLFVNITGSGFDFVVDNDYSECAPLVSKFSIVPTPQPGDLTFIKWYFELSDEVGTWVSGDELLNSSTGTNIYVAGGPDGNGFYDVALVVDGALCRDSIYKDDFIFKGGPAGNFSFSPTTICAPDVVVFSQVGISRTDTIIWDFGDGQTLQAGIITDNIPITYNEPGVYTPQILLKNDDCLLPQALTSNAERDLIVSGLRAGGATDIDFICDGGTLQFSDATEILEDDVTMDQIAQSLWTFGDGSSSNDLNPSHFYNGSVTGNLTVTHEITTDYGCVDDTSFNVKVFDTPSGTVNPVDLNCAGQEFNVSASGAQNYEWTSDDPSAIIINPNDATTPVILNDTTILSVLMYNDTIVCADSQAIVANVIDKIDAIAASDAQICIGESVQLFAQAVNLPPSSTLTYSWTPSDGLDNPNIENPVATPDNFTIYTVQVSSGNCAPGSASIQIEVDGVPFVNAGDDQVVSSGDSAVLTAFSPGIVTYSWFDSEGNFINNTQSITTNSITETSTFYVEVGNAGCRAIDSVIVVILEECDGVVNIPNIFTPNDDGVNDYLRINPGVGIDEISAFKVFNRWGEPVYETSATSIEWDGKQNGQNLNPGVYVYYLEFVCANGDKTIKKGNITLLK